MFPPSVSFPNDFDSDYTLFLVFNSTESKLCKDNAAWAEEIDITSSDAWADNGFGNIEGELFYYDSVEKVDGKVVKLKGCARQLIGKTKFNYKGVWVRGYVVAEHHNQLVDVILKIEDFIGRNFDPRVFTLDWRIRNLAGLNTIFDDYNCPDLSFSFDIVEDDKETGILANYSVTVSPPGSVSSFRLDFGDGEFTTTVLSGQHRYALNAVIDPVVTVSNGKCQIVQTPITRDNPVEPKIIDNEVFDIPIPESPTIPDFTFVPCTVPEPDINLPPLVFPCISLEEGVPSIIIGPDIHMVSQVVIIGPDHPIQITQSVITIEGNLNIPSVIFIDITPTIVIDPPIPPTIVVIADTSAITLDIGELPKLEVDWGVPPSMEVSLNIVRPVTRMLSATPNEFGDEFADLFQASEHVKVEYEQVSIPSEIRVIAPDIKVDMPKKIYLEPTEVKISIDKIPERISLDHDVPEVITLVGAEIPHRIEVVSDIPKRIEMPDKIVIEMLEKIPDKIVLDASGLPESIRVLGIPEFIQLLPPKEPIEMVYRGSPIPVEVKVTMADMMPTTAEGQQCVMILPCPGR